MRAASAVLQFVEFVQYGVVTRRQSGSMPESHRHARNFLAARLRLPALSKLASGSPEQAEEAHGLSVRVREALTALADLYCQQLVGSPEALTWFRSKYGTSEETILRPKIGYADHGEPSAARTLMDGPGEFTTRVDRHISVPPNSSRRRDSVLRSADRVPLLEPRSRRVHDRPQDAMDAGPRMGEVQVQEARHPQ
jgi:hypothetical protein